MVFLGLFSGVALAVSAWMGFQNYTDYQRRVQDLESERLLIQKMQSSLVEKKTQIQDLRQSKITVRDAINQSQNLLDQQTQKNQNMRRQVESLQKVVNQLNQSIAEFPDVSAEIEELKQRAKDMRSREGRLEFLSDRVTKASGHVKALSARAKQLDQSIYKKQEKVAEYQNQTSSSTLEAKIDRVFLDLEFVTMSVGDRDGVVRGSRLIVLRGGEKVAELIVTTVEERRSAADIVLKMPKKRVRSGDRVVAAGQFVDDSREGE